MRPDEARDAGALLGAALGEVAVVVQDVHKAVAGRVFAALGTYTLPVRLLHDAVSSISYTSTRLGVRVLPPVAGLLAEARLDPSGPSLQERPWGRFALGALNGFWGDRLAEQRPALAPVMRIRTHDGALRRVPANVVHDLAIGPDAPTGRIVIFLHGLCESDVSWSFRAERTWGERGQTYGSKLRADCGWTPLYASFNSGRHICENGYELAEQLDELMRLWPVPVTELSLVGHSMGGLIARSAAHQGAEQGHAWTAALRHLIGLGAPHLGAPLERAVNKGTHAMSKLPETLPIATWLNRRSVGIKDLRHGALTEAEWFGFDPEDPADNCTDLPFPPDVAHYAVSATLSRTPHSALPFFGDLLVDHASATGQGQVRKLAFEVERTLHLGGRHHFHLLADPVVYDHMRTWLA
ncbi:MAG: GPI inositol-deacylase [Actinomycetota bacterium]|nr:GPI inositol-deacylase [Actinomycetota bacterium]